MSNLVYLLLNNIKDEIEELFIQGMESSYNKMRIVFLNHRSSSHFPHQIISSKLSPLYKSIFL